MLPRSPQTHATKRTGPIAADAASERAGGPSTGSRRATAPVTAASPPPTPRRTNAIEAHDQAAREAGGPGRRGFAASVRRQRVQQRGARPGLPRGGRAATTRLRRFSSEAARPATRRTPATKAGPQVRGPETTRLGAACPAARTRRAKALPFLVPRLAPRPSRGPRAGPGRPPPRRLFSFRGPRSAGGGPARPAWGPPARPRPPPRRVPAPRLCRGRPPHRQHTHEERVPDAPGRIERTTGHRGSACAPLRPAPPPPPEEAGPDLRAEDRGRPGPFAGSPPAHEKAAWGPPPQAPDRYPPTQSLRRVLPGSGSPGAPGARAPLPEPRSAPAPCAPGLAYAERRRSAAAGRAGAADAKPSAPSRRPPCGRRAMGHPRPSGAASPRGWCPEFSATSPNRPPTGGPTVRVRLDSDASP